MTRSRLVVTYPANFPQSPFRANFRVADHSGVIFLSIALGGTFGGGILTVYLIGTGWLTARRRDGETSHFDWVVLLIPLTLGALTWMNGLKVVRSGAASQDGVPVGMTFFMGSVMLLAGAGDVRMLLRRGVFGAKRIARHLWRMCFGLFIAAGSFFLGPSNRPLRLLSVVGLGQHLSPVLFSTPLYLFLSVLPNGFADFLASPSALQKRIPGVDTTRLRKSGVHAIAGRVNPAARISPSPASDCGWMTGNSEVISRPLD
jgi:hypothetical protein